MHILGTYIVETFRCIKSLRLHLRLPRLDKSKQPATFYYSNFPLDAKPNV